MLAALDPTLGDLAGAFGLIVTGTATILGARWAYLAKTQATAANKAVNNVPLGERSLLQRVGALEENSRWQSDSLHKVAQVVGADIEPPPPGA